MSTANPNIAAIRQQVEQAYNELQALLDGPLSALYAEKLYQTPEENTWSVMENLAHIVEFLPYWAGEITRLVEEPGRPFGRTIGDPARLAFLREHGHDSLVQIRAALPASYAHLDQVLSSLNDSDLARTGLHPRYGEQTLAWFIDEFVTRHLHNHVVQIRECLQAIA